MGSRVSEVSMDRILSDQRSLTSSSFPQHKTSGVRILMDLNKLVSCKSNLLWIMVGLSVISLNFQTSCVKPFTSICVAQSLVVITFN